MPRKLRKTVRKPPKALLKRARKYRVKVTRKVGSKRLYKSVTLIKKQIKKAMRRNKRSRTRTIKRKVRRSRFGVVQQGLFTAAVKYAKSKGLTEKEIEGLQAKLLEQFSLSTIAIGNLQKVMDKQPFNSDKYKKYKKQLDKLYELDDELDDELDPPNGRTLNLMINNIIGRRSRFGEFRRPEEIQADEEKMRAIAEANKIFNKKRKECPWSTWFLGDCRNWTNKQLGINN